MFLSSNRRRQSCLFQQVMPNNFWNSLCPEFHSFRSKLVTYLRNANLVWYFQTKSYDRFRSDSEISHRMFIGNLWPFNRARFWFTEIRAFELHLKYFTQSLWSSKSHSIDDAWTSCRSRPLEHFPSHSTWRWICVRPSAPLLMFNGWTFTVWCDF